MPPSRPLPPLNVLKGKDITITGWDTNPSNLSNIYDGDLSTYSGTGQTVKSGSGDVGYWVIDLGYTPLRPINIGVVIGAWLGSTGSTINITLDQSSTGSSYDSSQTIAQFTTASEVIKPSLRVTTIKRYIRVRVSVTGAATVNVNLYDIRGNLT